MKRTAKIFLVLIVLAVIIEETKPTVADRQEESDKWVPVTNEMHLSTNAYNSEIDSVQYPCVMCDGTGKIECRVCHGTGENEMYGQLSLVMKGFSKPYCEACDRRGWNVCGRCHGTGLD